MLCTEYNVQGIYFLGVLGVDAVDTGLDLAEGTLYSRKAQPKSKKSNGYGKKLYQFWITVQGYRLTMRKNKKPVNNGFDPDADYSEDEENYLGSIPEEDEEDI